jgi:hypothetical protein
MEEDGVIMKEETGGREAMGSTRANLFPVKFGRVHGLLRFMDYTISSHHKLVFSLFMYSSLKIFTSM